MEESESKQKNTKCTFAIFVLLYREKWIHPYMHIQCIYYRLSVLLLLQHWYTRSICRMSWMCMSINLIIQWIYLEVKWWKTPLVVEWQT